MRKSSFVRLTCAIIAV